MALVTSRDRPHSAAMRAAAAPPVKTIAARSWRPPAVWVVLALLPTRRDSHTVVSAPESPLSTARPPRQAARGCGCRRWSPPRVAALASGLLGAGSWPCPARRGLVVREAVSKPSASAGCRCASTRHVSAGCNCVMKRMAFFIPHAHPFDQLVILLNHVDCIAVSPGGGPTLTASTA